MLIAESGGAALGEAAGHTGGCHVRSAGGSQVVASCCPHMEISGLPANSTAYSDTDLECGTTIYYRVRAYRVNDGQYSAYSDVASAETEICGLETVGFLPFLVKR